MDREQDGRSGAAIDAEDPPEGDAATDQDALTSLDLTHEIGRRLRLARHRQGLTRHALSARTAGAMSKTRISTVGLPPRGRARHGVPVTPFPRRQPAEFDSPRPPLGVERPSHLTADIPAACAADAFSSHFELPSATHGTGLRHAAAR